MSSNFNNLIMSNLAKLMKEKELSSSEAALAMNISPSTMQRLLNREIVGIKVEHLHNFCARYNIPLSKLIPLEEEQQPTIFKSLLKGLYEYKQDDDSMSPTIERGDYVMVNLAVDEFKPYLYLIKDYNGLRVRRLSKDKYGNLIVKADNHNYETFNYSEEEQKKYIEIKGIVMYRITEFL